jgi:hypothetical protein
LKDEGQSESRERKHEIEHPTIPQQEGTERGHFKINNLPGFSAIEATCTLLGMRLTKHFGGYPRSRGRRGQGHMSKKHSRAGGQVFPGIKTQENMSHLQLVA